jgi:type IV secretion system protein VirB4
MNNVRSFSPLGFLDKARNPKLKDQALVNQEAIVEDHLTYVSHVSSSIIKTNNKEYMVSFELQGKEFATLDEEDVSFAKDSLNNHIRTICSAQEGISFWSYIVREKVEVGLSGEFNNPFCAELNQKYLEKFKFQNTFINRLFLTIVIKQGDSQEQSIQNLEDIVSQFNTSLSAYNIKVLTTYTENNILYSKALEFYGYLINKEWIKMPVLNVPIKSYLSLNRLFFSNENIEVRTLNKKSIGAVLDIKEYNESTTPEQLNEFLKVPFEMTICQSFCSMHKNKAKELLRIQKGHLSSTNDYGVSQIVQLDEALDDIESGRIAFGTHHCNIFVWSDNQLDLDKASAKVRELISDMGMIPKLVSPRPECAFFACMHNPSYRLRPAPITSKNFVCFSNFHNHFLGKATKNPWGSAVTLFETNNLTPVYFNFHEESLQDQTGDKALGNTIIIGQSGAGKTVLANFLLTNLDKFNSTTIFFDKDKGAKIALLAMGGKYFNLELGQRTHWNPLQLENTPENLIFLNNLLQTMLCHSGRTLTIQQIKELESSIKTVISLERQDRTLKNLCMSMAQISPEDIGSRMKEWINDGQYAWLFDNKNDELDLNTNAIFGFDCTQFLDHPIIRTPLMMYLLHRMEQIIDGRRFIFFMDEFWKLLQDPIFTSFAKDKLKTIRKQNGFGVFMTQEPADALESEIGKTIVQQVATQILLPNPKADEQDYKRGLKLSNTEFNLLTNFNVSSRQFIIKKGQSSSVAKLNLYGFKEINILSGNTQNTLLVENLIEEGYTTQQWLERLYNGE